MPFHLAERRGGRGFESRDDVAEPVLAGRCRTLRGETRQQRAIPMPSQGAVERHVNGRRIAATRVVGFEAAQFATQVVGRRVRRRIVEHRREQAGTAQLVDDGAFQQIGSRRRPARRGIEIEALATAQQCDVLGRKAWPGLGTLYQQAAGIGGCRRRGARRQPQHVRLRRRQRAFEKTAATRQRRNSTRQQQRPQPHRGISTPR